MRLSSIVVLCAGIIARAQDTTETVVDPVISSPTGSEPPTTDVEPSTTSPTSPPDGVSSDLGDTTAIISNTTSTVVDFSAYTSLCPEASDTDSQSEYLACSTSIGSAAAESCVEAATTCACYSRSSVQNTCLPSICPTSVVSSLASGLICPGDATTSVSLSDLPQPTEPGDGDGGDDDADDADDGEATTTDRGDVESTETSTDFAAVMTPGLIGMAAVAVAGAILG